MASPPLDPSWQTLPATAFCAALVGGIVAAFMYGSAGVAVPVSAVCSLAVLWSTTTRVRSALAVDHRRAFALALGASATLFFLCAWIVPIHLRPAWVESTYLPRDHREPPAWPMIPATLSMLGLPLLVALTEFGAARLHRPLRVAVRALVAPLAVAVTALAVVGLSRCATLPAPRSPVGRIPIVATLRAPSAEGVTERHPLGTLTLAVTCVRSYTVRCHVLLLRDPSAALPAGWPAAHLLPHGGTHEESGAAPGAPLQVRHDARRDLWVVEVLLPPDRPPAFRTHPIAAFRGRDLARIDLDLRAFPGEFSPPLGWPLAALLGVALAAWFTRRARFVDPLPGGALLDARAVGGTLHLPDGTTLAAPPATPVVTGPVVVAAPPPVGPYRDAAMASVLRAGTVARWRDDVADDRDVRSALAFSTLVLLGAPLLLAALLRLLW
jgi:hypothetical protein